MNRFSVYPTPAYHDTVKAILDPGKREELYADYSHDISPVSDDRPFYYHLFRWSQTAEILRSLGRTFQPFGGAGFLIVLGSLVVAVAAAGAFILLPLLFRRDVSNGGGSQADAIGRLWPFVYFAGLGLGFLWVEIPLLQRFILYLDQPAYAFATVLFGVLVWSGVGSLASDRLRVSMAVAVSVVAALSVLYAYGLPVVFDATLGLPLAGRLALSVGAACAARRCNGSAIPPCRPCAGGAGARTRPLGMGGQRIGIRGERDPRNDSRAVVRLHLGDSGWGHGVSGRCARRPRVAAKGVRKPRGGLIEGVRQVSQNVRGELVEP